MENLSNKKVSPKIMQPEGAFFGAEKKLEIGGACLHWRSSAYDMT